MEKQLETNGIGNFKTSITLAIFGSYWTCRPRSFVENFFTIVGSTRCSAYGSKLHWVKFQNRLIGHILAKCGIWALSTVVPSQIRDRQLWLKPSILLYSVKNHQGIIIHPGVLVSCICTLIQANSFPSVAGILSRPSMLQVKLGNLISALVSARCKQAHLYHF